MKGLTELTDAEHLIVQQAVDALRQFHEAQAANLPEAEVNRLRLQAESLFQAITDYRLHYLGAPSSTRH
nr:hypothetical protein [Pseudomonas sp. NFACC42-2]